MADNTAGKDGKDKKSRREYIQDFRNILAAVKRTLKYAFRTTPLNTSGMVLTETIVSITPFISTWLISRIIDELVTLATQNSTISQDMWVNISMLVALQIFTSLMYRFYDYFDLSFYYDFSREFDRDVNTKFAYLDTEHYEDPETNNLLQKVRENYSGTPLSFISQVTTAIGTIVSVGSAFFIVFFYSPILVFLMLIATIPQFVNNVIFGRRKWTIWSDKGDLRRDYSSSRWHLSREGSLQELRIFKVRDYLIDRVYKLYTDFQDAQKKTEFNRIKVRGILDFAFIVGYTVSLIILVRDVVAGIISIGDFNFYLSTLRRLESSFGQFFRRMSRVYEDGLFMVDIYNFMDLETKIVSGEVTLHYNQKPPIIQFEDITFNYPSSKEKIFDGLDLTIESGEHIAIVGENGAGKTTLIKLLMRFYDVKNGRILVDGVDLKNIDIESWYQTVGALFQDFNTYHFSAQENIGIGNANNIEDFKKIVEAAKKAEAHEFIEKYEHKYKQILSKAFEGGIKPSTGQWQRIALARTFFKNAPVLILDEPTSAIDPKAEFQIFERLFEFAKGKTVIIISHRFSTVRNANRIIVLDKGRIIEDGSHEELMQITNGKYKNAFEIQKRGYE